MNDICASSQKLEYILYADDTSVFLSDNNIDNLILDSNDELLKINSWLISNKLIVNTRKTHYMIFTDMFIDSDTLVVSLNNNVINRCSSLKSLGVTIDNKVSWKEHIDIVCTNISKGIGILNKIKHFPSNISIMIYNAIISPHFNYCNLAWGSSTDHAMIRLLCLQKRAIRLVFNADYFAHTKPLFLKLKLLNVLDLCNDSFCNSYVLMF